MTTALVGAIALATTAFLLGYVKGTIGARCHSCEYGKVKSEAKTAAVKRNASLGGIARANKYKQKRISENPADLSEHGPESAHSGKQNTADKSELLPTQLPKAE